MRILIAGGGTGGHLMPALALARAAASQGVEPVLVGAMRGIEAQVLPSLPLSPFADGAAVPPNLVAQPALAVHRRARLAGGRPCARRRAPGDRGRHGRVR